MQRNATRMKLHLGHGRSAGARGCVARRRMRLKALASGIPAVFDALRAAELPPPVFDDDGLRFTVVLRQRVTDHAPPVKAGSSAAKVLSALNDVINRRQP